jgi:MFS family permease
MTTQQTFAEKDEMLVSDVKHVEGSLYDEEDAHIKEKNLVRKIDMMVMPWLCILYAFSFIDRSNISAAKIAGMAEDLHLTGYRYSIALLVFFPTYIAIEIPSNYLIKRVGTKYWMAFLICAWGAVAMCCGFVQSYDQLLALRVLLGLTEGGFAVSLLRLQCTDELC